MNTTKIALFAGALAVAAGGLVVALRMNPSANSTEGAGTIGALVKSAPQTNEVNPFTHTASIPVGVDPSTIRFEKLKNIELASKTKTTIDLEHCKEQQFRDPDGSGCQTTAVLERIKAVEAKYSYTGLDLGTGESTPGRQTFSVYFKPEEVPTDGPAEKMKRDQAAALFQVNTYRSMVEQKVIDKQHSQFCAGSYIDGSWVHSDAKCQDQVQFVSQAVPSPYLTVQVEMRNPAVTGTH